MAENKRRGRFTRGSDDDDSQSIFDLFEPPPEAGSSTFGRIPIIRDGMEGDDGAGEADDSLDLTDVEYVEAQAAAEAEAAGLRHWTEPATGQVPAALGAQAPAGTELQGPSWRGEEPDWAGPDLADVFADTEAITHERTGPSVLADTGADLDPDFDPNLASVGRDRFAELTPDLERRDRGRDRPANGTSDLGLEGLGLDDIRVESPKRDRPSVDDTASRPRPAPSGRPPSVSRSEAGTSSIFGDATPLSSGRRRATGSPSVIDSGPQGRVGERPAPRPVTGANRAVSLDSPRPAATVPPPTGGRRTPPPRSAAHDDSPVEGASPVPRVRGTQDPGIDRPAMIDPDATGPAARIPRPRPQPKADQAPARRPDGREAGAGVLKAEADPVYGQDLDQDYDDYELYDEEPRSRGLAQRVAVGIALIAVVLVALGVGPLPTLALVGVASLLAVMELFNAMRTAGLRPATLLGMVGAVALPVATYVRGEAGYPLVVGLAVVFGMLWYLTGADTERPVLNLGLTLTGVLWVGGLAGFAALMIRADQGRSLLLATIIITAVSDSLAYLGGRAYGTKPFHSASPNKTWEGTMTGFFGALFAGLVLGVTDAISLFDQSFTGLMVLAAVVGVLAPIGDLAESLVKRDLGIKDMGTLLPGHGGVLDRVDGLLFALPGAYYVAVVYQLL